MLEIVLEQVDKIIAVLENERLHCGLLLAPKNI